MLRRLKRFVQDPPPPVIVEISAVGVSAVKRDPKTGGIATRSRIDLSPGLLDPSPNHSNVQDAAAFEETVGRVLDELGELRRPDVALILPDNCSRLTAVDFDSLPGDANERLKLIRFRLKKTVPFDVEEARIIYRTWPTPNGLVALVAATPDEIIRQYEAPFERRGLWPGYVSLSTCSALNLLPEGLMTLFVKRAGRELTLAAVEAGTVRMVRSLELAASSPSEDDWSESARDIYPTLVFIEDHFGSPVSKLVLCGFDSMPVDTGCEVKPLRSIEGAVDSREAGIWGFMSVN
jgi:type IV pilus assembly protein PilM